MSRALPLKARDFRAASVTETKPPATEAVPLRRFAQPRGKA